MEADPTTFPVAVLNTNQVRLCGSWDEPVVGMDRLRRHSKTVNTVRSDNLSFSSPLSEAKFFMAFLVWDLVAQQIISVQIISGQIPRNSFTWVW